MRIVTAKIWLMATMSLEVTNVVGQAEGPLPPLGFRWEKGAFTGIDSAAVFNLDSSQNGREPNAKSKRFEWKSHGGHQVLGVNLYEDGNPTPIGTGNKKDSGTDHLNDRDPRGKAFVSRDNEARQAGLLQPIDLDVHQKNQNGYVEIPNIYDLLKYQTKVMFFEVALVGEGYTYSRIFTVVESQAIAEALPSTDKFYDDKPSRNYSTTGIARPIEPSTTKSISEATGPTLASSIMSLPGDSDPTIPVSQPTSFTEAAVRSPSGLSNGAIAGIAVACGVVLLALIAALVWLILRRRQQNKASGGAGAYGLDRSRTDELIAEKEAGASADHSPHSPYSDDGVAGNGGGHDMHTYPSNGPVGGDGVMMGAPGVGAAGAATMMPAHPPSQDPLLHQQQHDQAHSYTAYSDHMSHDGGAPSIGGGNAVAMGSPRSTHAASIAHSEAPTTATGVLPPVINDGRRGSGSIISGTASPVPGGRATPHVVSAQYAHLVEEGMTEEEIRRLEDEERALDAAIEQAGSNNTGARR